MILQSTFLIFWSGKFPKFYLLPKYYWQFFFFFFFPISLILCFSSSAKVLQLLRIISRVKRKAGEAFNASMTMQNTSGGKKLLIFSQISFYFLWQLGPGYTRVMVLQVSISSAKRKIEISPLNSVSEKDQLSLRWLQN